MNKKILILPLLLSIIIVSGYLITKSYAQENSKTLSPLLQGLIKKFNLNENEVETFVSEYRQIHQQEMQEKRSQEINNRLNELVTAGTITEAQKNELLAMTNSHQTEMLQNKDKTKEEIRNIMEENRKELETWAENNKININDLHIGVFGNGGGAMRLNKGVGFGDRGAMR